MKILLLVLVVSVGCARRITPKDYIEAQRLCEQNGGLHHIDTEGTKDAVCNLRNEGDDSKYKRIN